VTARQNKRCNRILEGRIIYLKECNYVSRYCVCYCHHFILWHFCPVCQGLWEVLAMLDIIVGLIGVVLIIYLLASVIRPELF
jgi:hypothetical protein